MAFMLKCSWMQLKQKVTSKIKKIIKLPVWITIPAAFGLLSFIICFVAFFIEKPVQFSYGQETCAQQLTILPSVSKVSGNDNGFIVENKDALRLGELQFLSLRTCFSAKKVPNVGDVRIRIAPYGGWFAKKTFKLSVPQPPLVKVGVLTKLIPTAKPLVMALSDSDSVFNYQLEVEGKTADCPVKDSAIHCDIVSLHLLQDKNYDMKLVRFFESQRIATLVSKNIKTLNSTKVINSSVAQGQVIYDKPKSFTFDFDKGITKSSIILEKVEGDNRTPVPTIVSFKDKQASATIKDDLSRDSTYEFTINEFEAKDGSTLSEPYKLDFKMSDGPGVASVNVNAVGLPFSQTIVLTLDQSVIETQDITNFVSTSGIPTSISASKNQVFIRYDNAPICADLNIAIKPGLTSVNGIVQNDSWGFSTRTVCHTTLTIGYSVLGRPILAYIFGSGSTTVLFTGGIHGSEPSGSYIMYDFISYLEGNATKIPVNKKIVIVPEVNPDGLAASSRYNSNNVNIDRNFPSANWAADIDTSSGLVVGGGGSSALSEPETKALANLTASLQPRLEVSFHAKGNLVGANQSGDSVSIANQYASSVGYRSMIGQAEETMGYPITGEYEDWAGEQGIPAILIELPTSTGRHFWAHQSILWKMVNL